MNVLENRCSLFLAAALALGLAGCPTDDEPPTSQDTEGDSDGDEVCDPVGVDAEMGMLLNAPVADDVEVIQKQAQHPGSAGPTDLP